VDYFLKQPPSVLASGPTGPSVVGSNPAEDGGFLWVIKIRRVIAAAVVD
jgi:hypothetical protein